MDKKWYTVAQLAELGLTTEHTILHHVNTGALVAVNIARDANGPPRWRISAEAWLAFCTSRTHMPPPPKIRRQRKKPGDVIEFYN